MIRQTSAAALEKALDGVALREQAIADNIANAETPGHRPKRVSFEEALRSAVKIEIGTTGQGADNVIEEVTPRTRREPAAERWGVTVNLEREMVDLARTNLQHEAVARMLGKTFKMLRSAITGGSQ